jgi:pimeloyl-ACP methyl ester carboxylesterase
MDKLGYNAVAVGHGMGGLLALKAAERHSVSAVVLLDSELPRDLRPAIRRHELRDIPDVFGRDLIGWETLPEKLQRENRDLTIADIVRLQHLFGQKPHDSGLARREILEGIDRPLRLGVPMLVVGGPGRFSSRPGRRLAVAGRRL